MTTLTEDWLDRCRSEKAGILEPRIVNLIVQGKLYLAFLSDLLMPDEESGFSRDISERAISSFRKHKIKTVVLCSEGIKLENLPPNMTAIRMRDDSSPPGNGSKLQDVLLAARDTQMQPLCVVGISPASLMGAALLACYIGVTGRPLGGSCQGLSHVLGQEFLANKKYQRFVLESLAKEAETSPPVLEERQGPKEIYAKSRPKTPQLEPWSDEEVITPRHK